MTHWRATSGTAPGVEQPQSRSHLREGTPRNSNQFTAQSGEPFTHPFELGSSLLFLFVVLAPIVIVSGVVIGYLAFVPQTIQN